MFYLLRQYTVYYCGIFYLYEVLGVGAVVA